jgi:hypothetical protein
VRPSTDVSWEGWNAILRGMVKFRSGLQGFSVSAWMKAFLAWALVFSWASTPAAAAPRLSPAESAVINEKISRLKHPQERALAAHWSDAKKVAEMICRPFATTSLKRRIKGADRVFLGTDDPSTLRLLSENRLEGCGQVRIVSDWRDFSSSVTLIRRLENQRVQHNSYVFGGDGPINCG